MKNDNYIHLSIVPIDEQTACLTDVIGEVDANSIFTLIGKYEGHNYYPTEEDVRIEKGIYNGRIYTITQIKGCCFSHCRDIKNIIIGPFVSIIEWNMYQCSSLTNIFVDVQNPIYKDISGVLFKDKELIAFPQGRVGHYIVPNGIKKIGNHAFKSCRIDSIEFPETLEEIGINAFYECNRIKEFILPASIKKIASICNTGNRPITQKFYLSTDKNKTTPMTINDVKKLFPT